MAAPVIAPAIVAAIRAGATTLTREELVRRFGAAAVGRALLSDEDRERPVSVEVQSTAISAISWKDEVITVTFKRDGRTHSYPGSRDLFEDFVNAPSIGQYFNAHIR